MFEIREHPAVLEINAWVWITELSKRLSGPVTLGTVPPETLDSLADAGFDAVWLMGVWTRSAEGSRIALEHPGLREEFGRALPDFTPDDVVGSPYAIREYEVDPALGDAGGLAKFRKELNDRRLGLILDFVPNHLALDHPWVAEHPGRFVRGDENRIREEPQNWFRAGEGGNGPILAHGRDPNFPGWTDTVQLDYRKPETRQAMADLILDIVARCDGARVDMAMLPIRDVFLRTWGGNFDPPRAEFWPAAVTRLEAGFPNFRMIAEAYWDLEWELQQMGFDHCYDKRLYDRLRKGDVGPVRAHLEAERSFQDLLVRFVENHDESRAAEAFGEEGSRPAALVALTLPGLRLFHHGQLEGRRVRLPVQLARRPEELPNPDLQRFYDGLLEALKHPVFHRGEWALVSPLRSTPDDDSSDRVVAFQWTWGEEHRLVAANLSPHPSRARLPLDLPGRSHGGWTFSDVLGTERFDRSAEEAASGLLLELPGHAARLYKVKS